MSFTIGAKKKEKKNIVLLTAQEETFKAESFEKYIHKDPFFSTVSVSCGQLRCTPYTHIVDRIFPEGTKARNFIMKYLPRFYAHKDDFSYGGLFGIPQKALENLFFRFHPAGIVVADPYTLRNVAHYLKKTNTSCKIFIVCNQHFSKKDLAIADYFLVKAETLKSDFFPSDISESRIFCYVPSDEEVTVWKKREEAKKRLKINEKGKFVLFDVSNVFSIQPGFGEYLQSNSFPQPCRFYCGNNDNIKAVLDDNSAYNILSQEKDMYYDATDILFTVGEAETVEKAKKDHKEVIVLRTPETEQYYHDMITDNTVKKVETKDEIKEEFKYFLQREKWQSGFEEVIKKAFYQVFSEEEESDNQ